MEDLINKLSDAVSVYNKGSLFSQSTQDIERCCIDILRNNGYRVISPTIYRRKIKDLKDLVSYFYNLLDTIRDGGYMMAYNMKRDLSVAKRFVEDRMRKCGYSKAVAMNECGEIVRTVIENYESFKFNINVGFFIFGQANMSWVTDKALKIMDGKNKIESERKEEALISIMVDNMVDDFGFSDLDEIVDKMEEV